MNLLLSEILPLRTTRMLGDYAVDAVLAHRYGDLTAARFELKRLTDSTFFVADHPMTVAQLFIGNQETLAWAQETKSDDAGHTWTIVNTGAGVDPALAVSATGTGKRNPRTGALLENPADIIEDASRIGGRTDVFPALRAECAAAGIRIAGSIDQLISLRATIDAITESIGAIWTPQMARLYPVATISGAVLELLAGRDNVSDLVVSASLVDTADVLQLSYDVSDATGRAQHSIELTASPARYGGLPVQISSPWLRLPANAESIGRPMLERMAGDRYDVAFSSSRTDIRPGSWWKLVEHPAWPFDGADPILMIISVDVAPDADSSLVKAEAILARPLVTVTGHSIALSSITQGGIDIAYKNGIATFRFTDLAGKPIKNARVSFDGSLAKTTNDQGQVSFIAAPGKHKIAVEADGFTPIEAEITL